MYLFYVYSILFICKNIKYRNSLFHSEIFFIRFIYNNTLFFLYAIVLFIFRRGPRSQKG